MIDLLCILFTTGMILMVVVRAVMLDRTLPWFRAIAPNADPTPAPSGRPSSRRDRRPAQRSGRTASPEPAAEPVIPPDAPGGRRRSR